MPTLDTIVVEVIERGPQGPQVPDGDKTDITVSSNGTTWQINSGAVGTSELATNAVTTAKITDSNVTTAKIADLNVTTGKLAANAVTRAKINSDAYASDAEGFTGTITDKIVSPAVFKSGFLNRGWVSLLGEYPSTDRDYGTDATDNIQDFVDFCSTRGALGYSPAGVYKIGGTVTIGGNGTTLEGDSWLSTILKSPNADNTILTFDGGISSVSVRCIGLDRVPTATSNGHGLVTPAGAYIDCHLERIWSRRSYDGFRLGATAYAEAVFLRSENNVRHGVYQTNSAAATGGQWYAHKIYSGNNGGSGWHVESDASAGTGFPIGELTDYRSYGNTGNGFRAIGTALCPIQSVRGKEWFLGQDGDDEIYLDLYGVHHVFSGITIELPGTGLTGPANATAASNVGAGFKITSNCNDVKIVGADINGCSDSGIHSSTSKLHTIGVKSYNNGQAGTSGAATQSGIYIAAGTWIDEGFDTSDTAGTTQKYGAGINVDNDHKLTGHTLSGNNTAPIYAGTTLTKLKMSGGAPASVRTTDLTTPGGRLTLTTAVPIISSNVSNTATVYYTPFLHRFVPLWNGVNWSMHDIGGELSYSINESTYSPAAASTSIPYDLFVWERSTGVYQLSKGPAWSSASARGTGAGTTQLTRLNGMFVNTVDITNGPAANRGLYVGTIYSNVSALMSMNCFSIDCNGSAASNRCEVNVWNYYNRTDLVATVYDSTASWTYGTATVRQQNAQANAGWDVVAGRAEDDIEVTANHYLTCGSASVNHDIGVGIDSTAAFTGTYGSSATAATNALNYDSIGIRVAGAAGRRKINLLENVPQATSCTIYGGTPRMSKARIRC